MVSYRINHIMLAYSLQNENVLWDILYFSNGTLQLREKLIFEFNNS